MGEKVSKRIESTVLECVDCGNRRHVSAAILSERLGEPLSYSNVAELWPKFRCTQCGSRRNRLSDEDHKLLLDPDNLLRCQVCELAILLPRIQAIPSATMCQTCAEEDEKPSRPPPYPTPPPTLVTCRSCMQPTVVRENSQDGSLFVGCTAFPSCRWTAPLGDDDRL